MEIKPYPTTNPGLFHSLKGAPPPDVGYIAGVNLSQPGVISTLPTTTNMRDKRYSLHDALGSMKCEELIGFLSDHPKTINEKGFNGQSPLHKAVLNSPPEVVQTLLLHEADPNSRNNYEETPLHFACKRGNVTTMHYLLEHGAEIGAVDKSGKGVIHHCALGGSVYGIHYLTQVHGVTTHARDYNFTTPLHIASVHGHVEMLNYLLKKERADLFAKDAYGNNSVHIAARAGFSWTCWRLLEDGGLAMLHETNRDGLNPLSIAKQGKECKFKEVVRTLDYYTSLKQHSGKAQGPLIAWFINLILPAVIFPVILLLSFLWVAHRGWLVVAGMIIFCMILWQHSHRMNHTCKWPNPLFAGLFAAGMFHSFLCFYIEVVHYTYDTHQTLVMLAVVWTILLIYLYYMLLTKDPGLCTRPGRKGNGDNYTIRDVAVGFCRPDAICTVCEMIPPHRTHHCKLCTKCYLDTDHHCLFLYRCIATNNHCLFVHFMLSVLLAMFIFVYFCWQYLNILYPGGLVTSEIFHACPWVWTMFVSNILSIIWGINLLRYQLNVVSKNHTTAYQPNMGLTSLTGKQRFFNVVHFLMGNYPYAVDSTTIIT